MSKLVSSSLKLQLFFAVLVSLATAALIFGITIFAGNALLDRTVYGQAFARKMAERQISSLQDYIYESSISLENLQRLNAWFSRGKKIYLTVYMDDTIIYESPFSGQTRGALDPQKFDPDMEDSSNEFVLTFQGGVEARAFLYYYAGGIYYFWLTALAWLAAFISFSLSFVMLINRKLDYISQLKRELDILSGGQLEYPVTLDGSDELGELAAGIDHMRRSIIEHQEIEKQMRSANSELITAMSHDLRTPLTSLLAYLEIIERKKYADEGQMHSLIHKCLDQTLRIKAMADKLFEYFLAYSTEWESVEME